MNWSSMIAKEIIIENFIKNFIQKDKLERTSIELFNPKKRYKFINRLNHNWDSVIKTQLLLKVAKENDSSQVIKQILNFKDDELCYVISNYEAYDDQIIQFRTVFDNIYSRGLSTLLINISADTIFLDTEQVKGAAQRFIGRMK